MRAQVLQFAERCYWCKVPISDELPMGHPQKATVDHLIPEAEGGTHAIENLVPACWTCNTSRGKKSAENWNSPDVPGSEEW